MGEMWVEVCIVSARGLRRQSLWKLQWFAVGWVDPSNKYCTRFDTSGNPNPVWRTKFSASLDADSDCTLHVEVHSRDSVFLIDKLHGSAEVSLKEFLAKHQTDGVGDVGSFQLRKKGSNQPKGFVDVSIRTSLDKELDVISLPTPRGLQQVPFPSYTYRNPALGGPSYPQASGPIYKSPRANNGSSSYLNLPASGGGGNVRPGFAAGIGAGALAAGAVIFGDDFMSGFDLHSGIQIPSLSVAIDPPF